MASDLMTEAREDYELCISHPQLNHSLLLGARAKLVVKGTNKSSNTILLKY